MEFAKYGIQLGIDPDFVVTNLRFADGILIVGRSLHQVRQMITHVAREDARVGLDLHPSKTKTQYDNIGYGMRVRKAKAENTEIEVLDSSASAMYLVRALSLTETHDAELKH